MSGFNGQNLFGSGPHRFVAGGLSQRHALHEQPGADGARLTTLGRTARVIEQGGTLLADDAAGLAQQIGAIESAMDGRVGELIDDLGLAWPGTVMLEFAPGPLRRVGVRWAADYTVRYTQVQP